MNIMHTLEFDRQEIYSAIGEVVARQVAEEVAACLEERDPTEELRCCADEHGIDIIVRLTQGDVAMQLLADNANNITGAVESRAFFGAAADSDTGQADYIESAEITTFTEEQGRPAMPGDDEDEIDV